MGNFKINSMGICENPEVVASFENGNDIIHVLVAEYNNKWTTGFGYTDKATLLGYSKYPCFNDCSIYNSKRDAIVSEINHLLSMGNLDRRIVIALKDYRNTVMFEQLQLFG